MTLHLHPELVLAVAAVAVLYALGIGPWRRRHRWGPPVDPGRRLAFAAGTLLLAGAVLGPLAEWAERAALSAHMAQHLLLTLAVPPLWLAGTPDWLVRPLLRVPGVAGAGYWLTRPGLALPLAGAVLIAWHAPAAYEAALRVPALHALEHVSLLGSALLAWWPIAGPLPEWPRPAPPARLLYLLLSTLPMTAVAVPLTLADRVLYPFYLSAPGAWPLPPPSDQELAGTLMWVGGMLGYLAAGTVVFFRWAAAEGGDDAEPALLPEGP